MVYTANQDQTEWYKFKYMLLQLNKSDFIMDMF